MPLNFSITRNKFNTNILEPNFSKNVPTCGQFKHLPRRHVSIWRWKVTNYVARSRAMRLLLRGS